MLHQAGLYYANYLFVQSLCGGYPIALQKVYHLLLFWQIFVAVFPFWTNRSPTSWLSAGIPRRVGRVFWKAGDYSRRGKENLIFLPSRVFFLWNGEEGETRMAPPQNWEDRCSMIF